MPRTRNPDARSASQRAADADAALIAAGGAVTRTRLPPDVNRRVRAIMAERGETLTSVVVRAIMALER